MTGAYIRIKRDGVWQSIEIEYLTDEERVDFFCTRSHADKINWINMLCRSIASLEVQLNAK